MERKCQLKEQKAKEMEKIIAEEHVEFEQKSKQKQEKAKRKPKRERMSAEE